MTLPITLKAYLFWLLATVVVFNLCEQKTDAFAIISHPASIAVSSRCTSPHQHLLHDGRRSPLTAISSTTTSQEEIHPAVAGWPDKYNGSSSSAGGPRILHNDFTVVRASEKSLEELDVLNWPTWTTGDKEKWAVGNQNADKIMPYGELSYMISGKLEIVLPSGSAVIVEPGHFVTFPEGFQSSWRVLEELTWHYYLY